LNTTNSDEIRSLGRFVPSLLQSEVIETELRAYLPPCCQCERIGVRVPHEKAVVSPDANRAWHQDGGGAEGTTKHMVVWASELPTELRTSDGQEVRGEPFELIWFDNTKAFHRQPVATNEQTRWFLAVRCSGAMF
jgi:hypothetical protein